MPSSRLKLLVWVALVVGLFAAAALDRRGLQRYLRLRGEASEIEARNRVAARENRRLSREARALKDNPAAIQRAARDELGFIRPGELILQLRAPAP